MAFFRRIEKEVSRSSHKVDVEVIRPYAREFERIPGLGDPMRKLHESRVAVREAEKATREFQAKQSQAQESAKLRQGTRAALLSAEQARNRRIEMADALVGQEIGLFSTTPVDGTNLAVNSIPQLDPLDEMGNSIPEVT